jgi:hypothetical protein
MRSAKTFVASGVGRLGPKIKQNKKPGTLPGFFVST